MKYDPFQQQAIEYINQGFSVVVAAPTGAGKTVIAEHVITQALEKGDKIIYTAPVKALSNQKFRDFQQQFPDQVGILTGDVTINPQASTLIMTTEIFRNKILENRSSLNEYSWIIFDEIHFLDDYDRGSVWEESLIFLPSHMKILGLSATIPNIQQFCEWLTVVHERQIKIVQEQARPVPLSIAYQCQGKIYNELNHLIKEGFKLNSPRHTFKDFHKSKDDLHQLSNKPHHLVKYLLERNLLPCIYFVFSRKKTEYLASEVFRFNLLNLQERAEIVHLFDDLCRKFDLTQEYTAKQLRPFVEKGIAYHHAGMLPTLKEVVERLFTSRLIKIIFTTETFALGINMPARSVVFDELKKFYGTNFATLKTRDFYQMAGRAGRRQYDTEGHVFCRINPRFINPEQLDRVVYGKPEKVVSRFNASYATILNLYERYGEKLYDIYPKSFHFFQEKKMARDKAVLQLKTKVDVLKSLGHIEAQQVSAKGAFARRLYGYELFLSELFAQGVLEKLSEVELGILSVAVVFEPRKGDIKPKLNGHIRRLERTCQDVIEDIHQCEYDNDAVSLSKGCFFHLSLSIEAWIAGEPFDRILRYTNTDEGEVVRYFRMAIQVLREMIEADLPDKVKSKMFRLIELINRDIIDAEKQLRA